MVTINFHRYKNYEYIDLGSTNLTSQTNIEGSLNVKIFVSNEVEQVNIVVT